MPESGTVTVSRSAFLELRDEERLVRNGYEFLDEKRVQLAAEMLRERDAWRDARARFLTACESASAALREAVAAEGLEALQVLDVETLSDARFLRKERNFVGLSLIVVKPESGRQDITELSTRRSGVTRACIDAFRRVISLGVPLAARAANLETLIHEYERTERRVRALENVILPEIREHLGTMEEHLDLNEQEEVVRVRSLIHTGLR